MKIILFLIGFLFLAVGESQAVYRWVSPSGGAGAGCSGANVTTTLTDPGSYQTMSQVQACVGTSGGGHFVVMKGGSYGGFDVSMEGTSPSNRLTWMVAPGETAFVRTLFFSGFGKMNIISGTSGSSNLGASCNPGVAGGTFIIDWTSGGSFTGSNTTTAIREAWDSCIENVEMRYTDTGIGATQRTTFINILSHEHGKHASNLCDFSGQCHSYYSNAQGDSIIGGEFYGNEGYGIHCRPACDNLTVRSLRTHDHDSGGMTFIGGTGGISVQNVLSYNNGSYGVDVASPSVVINSSVFYNNGTAGLCASHGTSFTATNVFSIGNTSNVQTSCNGLPGTINVVTSVVTGSASAHFVDAANGDFRLCTGVGTPANCASGASSGLNNGSTLGGIYNIDILNVARPQGTAYDIGAYEMLAAGPPTLGVAITSPTSNASTVTNSGTINISGTYTGSPTTCSWVNSQGGGSQTCTTLAGGTWSVNSIVLTAHAVNVITVTIDDGAGGANPANDAISVAYSPKELIAAWGFDLGAETTDSSSNGNTLTVSGASTTAAGKYGRAYSFDGTDDVLTAASSTSLNKIIGGFTVVAQVFPTVVQTTFRTIAARDSQFQFHATAGTGFCANGSIQATFAGSNVNVICEPTTLLQTNNFTCIATTYDGVDMKIYSNGVETETKSVADLPNAGTNNFRIGASVFGEFFQGVIDEVRVYNYARTLSEIQTDCATAITSPPPPGALAIKLGANANALRFNANANALRIGPTP